MRFLYTSLFLFSILASKAQTWNLSWADEFNGNTLNTADWQYDIGTGSQFGLNGWGNNELQYYTNSTENVFVSGGNLHIVAKQQSLGGMNYTSGRIKTLNNVFGTYGKVEARIKLPSGQGIWPAFWMLREAGIWPGEIDIMETVGANPTTLHGTCHQGTAGNVFSLGGQYQSAQPLNNDFHVYSIEWYPDNILWFIDGIQYFEVNRADVNPNFEWLFDEDYFLLLNVAVGGNWPGSPDGSTVFPQEMLVDYVRWYDYTPELVPVTFRVDMSEQTLNGGDVVYLNGSFNNWCGSCNPMINTGNGVWTTTVSLPQGMHEYKFTTNGWNGLQETFSEGMPCTITTYSFPSNFVNRYANIGFDAEVLPVHCFNACSFCISNPLNGCTDPNAENFDPEAINDDGSCVYGVVFKVNVSELALTQSDNVYLNGGFNGWCGTCNPMVEVGQGLWETTVLLPWGNHEYKFTTNGWLGEIEYFTVGESCTNTTYGSQGEVFTNRVVNVTGNVELAEVCFNSCSACQPTAATVHFSVDAFALNATNVQLEMMVNGSMMPLLEMTHMAWDVWYTSINVTTGDVISYRFVADGAAETGVDCFEGGYRTYVVTAQEASVPLTCFGLCSPCSGCMDPLAANFNPFAVSSDQSCFGAVLEGCTYEDADNYNPSATSDNGSCIFTSNSCTGDLNLDGVVGTADLLEMLSAFGTNCVN